MIACSEGRPGKSARVRTLAISLLAAASPLAPGTPSLQAQVSPDILQVLQQGGAWVALAIEDGVGSFESAPVPTLGIQLRGQLRIWEEHTGTWHVVMRDLARAEDPVILERLMVPGEPVDFDYQTGMLGQIRIDVRWSEARDTTLRVWVGTELTPGEKARRASQPVASDASRAQALDRNRDTATYSYLLMYTDVYCNYADSGSRVPAAGSVGEDAELGREPAIWRPSCAPTPRTREGSLRRPAIPRRHPAGPDLPSPGGLRSKPPLPRGWRHRPDRAA